ncbi:MAG TPA: Crp/Fnr family transcriptional regulator [Myxococcales bacterium]|jgi:CRP/FNR family cyclic AMP-dependent transcriptional regulator|nr:Crp/Fnr family transcriptional regulator [Myxococcales bacterium]
MAEEELQAFLAKTSFFGGLMPDVVGVVAAMLKERRIAAGEELFGEGDQGRSMFIVRDGALIVRRHCTDGTQARLLMMRPGDFFGVTSLIDMEPRPFSCCAEKDSLLYELTNLDLYKLYKTDAKTYVLVLQNINRELCRRLRKAGQRIATLEDALHAATGRHDEH